LSFKKVTIHSDGTGPGSVVLSEDGHKLDNVIDATIWITAGELTRVDLTLTGVPSIIEGHLDMIYFYCPNCDENISHQCKPKTLSGQ
jgi:hypothetical protein